MKNYVYSLLLILFFSSCKDDSSSAEEKKDEPKKQEITIPKAEPKTTEKSPEVVFMVQVGAFSSPNSKFSSIPKIQTFNENGLIKYRLGEFKNYREARKFRNKIRDTYSDAFIQAMNGSLSINIADAINLQR